MTAKEKIVSFIEQNRQDFIRVSDGIWDAAELGLREYKSARLLIDELEKHGFTVTAGLGGIPTAFEAKWGEGKPAVGICGEFDALPELSQVAGCNVQKPLVEGAPGHGCMHHLLGAGAMAAAIAVRYYMEENKIPGSISFFGCPGEERGSGKVFMARAGAFDHLDAALSWHPDDFTTPWSTGNSATVKADFTFRGKAAHAARVPFMGRSALDAVELMSVGCNYLREHMPPNTMLHYGYKSAGNPSPNIVQDYACVTYAVRGANISDVNDLLERVAKVAKGAAMMTETEVTYENGDGTPEYSANLTLNRILSDALHQIGPPPFDEEDIKLAAYMREGLTEEQLRCRNSFMTGLTPEDAPDYCVTHPLSDLVADMLESTPVVIPSSSDIGAVSYVVPTAQVAVACRVVGGPNHSWLVTAQGKTSFAHKGMLTAAKALGLGAVMMLEQNAREDGALFRAAREEMMKKTGGKLVAPFPDTLMPDVEKDVTL